MSTTDRDPLFPAERLFVVALRRDSPTDPQRCSGRIEQLVSGRSASFEGARELFRFITTQLQGRDRSVATRPQRDPSTHAAKAASTRRRNEP